MDQLPPKDEHHTLGRWMAIFGWISVIVVLTILFDFWLKKSMDPSGASQKVVTKEGIKQTIIRRNINNSYLAKGKINGKRVIFILDTGATDVVIPGKMAEKLKLEKGMRARARTAGGEITIFRTKIKELEVGHIKIRNVPASINPKMPGTKVLLGMSALKHVTFMQQGKQLILTVED